MPARHLGLLLAVAGCIFFAWLGRLPLLEPDEGRNAEVAREMLASGDWLIPHFDSLPYLDKPPVFFWSVAMAFKLMGFHEWAARAPSALLALATLLLVWFLARTMFSEVAGIRAGMVFATCPLVIAFSRLVIFDMMLTFLVAVAMTSFWLAEASDFRSARFDVSLFAALGVATLTKGPVGFLLPLLCVLVYEAVRRNLSDLKRLRWGLGAAIFSAAVLPWFIAVSVRHPEFPRYALWQETLARFTMDQAHRRGGLLYYLPIYLGGVFPWSLLLLFAGWNRLKRWKELRLDENRSAVFLLVWAGVTFLFFSISRSQLPAYFLPATIPLSILMAKVWGETDSGSSRPPDWLTAGFAALLGLGLLVALGSQPWVFAAAKLRLAKKLHPALAALLKPSLLYSGLILMTLAIVGRNVAARARGKFLSATTFALLAFTPPLLLVRWLVPLRAFAETHSSRRLAHTLLASPEKDWPLYGYYYFRTSLPFYLRRTVGLVTFDGDELTSNYVASRVKELRRREQLRAPSAARTRTFADFDSAPPGDRRLLDVLEFEALVRSSPQPRLVMVRNTHVGLLAYDLARIEPLWNGWDFSIWKIPGGSSAADEGKPSRVVSPFVP
jgi:4-amino-4-deoxy-L-arabinose transferase-like glycosyltransferase